MPTDSAVHRRLFMEGCLAAYRKRRHSRPSYDRTGDGFHFVLHLVTKNASEPFWQSIVWTVRPNLSSSFRHSVWSGETSSIIRTRKCVEDTTDDCGVEPSYGCWWRKEEAPESGCPLPLVGRCGRKVWIGIRHDSEEKILAFSVYSWQRNDGEPRRSIKRVGTGYFAQTLGKTAVMNLAWSGRAG
ncbi:hypothetical protein CORC01_09293 [Colletotrichum orchidophilum]|uniref:Uncharacterized protein n=1 Tax=Colletotrichum orchidophilum TaxID=1209926 RepID=A0A1G4B206_9PEZI|nr:uncharacterized protein CORC01_09293 [Colletotrichum orchidophilum]OHE95421.1 hypothetical protein CORC01_09293 [Colletotrichum orchidophilum]